MAYHSYGQQPHRQPSSASMYQITPASSAPRPGPGSYAQQPHAGAAVGRHSSTSSTYSMYPQTRPPRQPGYEAPHPSQRPCPPGADPKTWKWFVTVDQDGSGTITPYELQQALINGDHTKFDKDTIAMLFGMFDTDKSGTIGFDEFVSIFKYVESWQGIFRRYDADRSGTIEADELDKALSDFRRDRQLATPLQQNLMLPSLLEYKLSPALISILCKRYGGIQTGPRDGSEVGISFDRFVRCCVSIKALTDSFMAVDTDRDGWAQISYDQFLTMALSAP